MKYLSSRFEEYISECNSSNLHEELKDINDKLSKKIKKQNNIIYYGPCGTGKYTQALHYIQQFSPSVLKYERKIIVTTSNKKSYQFKVSDIHFEIDIQLLGCNAKVLFNEIYNNIIDIVSTKQNKTFFILCKNFHNIHSELLEIFNSYMQSLNHMNVKLIYIILTENISFINDNILKRCQIIPICRPTKKTYEKTLNVSLSKKTHKINNIKNIISEIDDLENINKKIVDLLIFNIKNYKKINFLEFRDTIYNIFICNLDLSECLHQIITHFIAIGSLKNKNIDNVFFKLCKFYKLYNNNYRPIYHLESFLYYLCKVVNEL
tara:strand:+ start:5745 stop:6704 length:960 start_codon:yes stop_codon:yes gene_type:complete